MSTTQQRLDAYLAAEARILARGQANRMGDLQAEQAELVSIQRAIAQLQAQLATEQRAVSGSHLSFATPVFCGGRR